MITQEILEKSYYQRLMPGHYIDTKNFQGEWKMAKISDRDNRYVQFTYDGHDLKTEQLFLGSFRMSPLRLNTQGYTGNQTKAYRTFMVPIGDLKNHLQMMFTKFLQFPDGNNELSFQLTQYIRGQLFVNVHTILSYESTFTLQQNDKIKKFFIGLIDFIAEACNRCLQYAKQYFQVSNNNKLLYLSSPRMALLYSLQQLLILLNLMLKVQNSRLITFFKNNKVVLLQQLISKAIEDRKLAKIANTLFLLNDNNGKWLPFAIRKQALKLFKKFYPDGKMPKYSVKDFNQVFQIYPFMLDYPIGVGKLVQQQYIKYMIAMLKQQSPFQAKLKSLQQLKKILQKQLKMNYFTPADILNFITEQGILQHMLNQFNFNPQIFKRFVPILQFYCKSKNLTQKQIGSLFKLASNRHQSQLNTIYQIITGITEFAPVDSLDSIFSDILTLDVNDQVTLQFIKNFTIKALISKSKSKSFLTSFFGKKPSSSKYGFYGLNLLWSEVQDNGKLKPKFVPICLQMIKSLFNEEILNTQRQTYIGNCFSLIDKKKSFGQSIRIIHGIINSYPTSAFISQSRKDVVQKMDSKYHVIDSIMKGIKSHKGINFQKVSYKDTLKFFFHFLEEHSQGLKIPIRVQNIQYLWYQGQIQLLMDLLRKNKTSAQLQRQEFWKKKFMKKLQIETIKDIFNKITTKKSFYERQLTQIQYYALDDLFISLHWSLKNIDINQRGTIRFNTINLLGLDFYFNFLLNFKNRKFHQVIIKKMIDICLRPKSQAIEDKVKNWKILLLKILQLLSKNYPILVHTLRTFFTFIQGKMIRQNVNLQGNLDIIVQNEGTEKVITLARSSTIFRLRKMIMKAFHIEGDFIMYNIQMKKDVTFVEQQDFSVNAMSYKQKGPQIIIRNHKFELHPHLQALQNFRQYIAGQQKLFNLLFQIIEKDQQLEKDVWGIIGMIPTNRSFVNKLKNCHDFDRKNWQQILYLKKNEQLLYFLNIISDMMNKTQKWTELIYVSQGIFVIQDMFIQKLKIFDNYPLIYKLSRILLKVYESVDKQLIDKQRLVIEIKSIILCFQVQFKNWKDKDQQQWIMSIQLFNNLLALVLRCYKLTKFELKQILNENKLIFALIEYSLFSKKDESKGAINSQQLIIDLVQGHFHDFQSRLQIIQTFIINFLSVQALSLKKSNQNYFVFLIDMLHTLTKQQQTILFSIQQIQKKIISFLNQVIDGGYQDSDKNSFNQLNWGALKLITYNLNGPLAFRPDLFNCILKQFIFNKQKKRIKHPKSKKQLYQITKKMLYSDSSKVSQFNSYIVSRLQTADWRKNAFASWSLQPEKNQKKLYVGLQNLTATCYINCLFQQLFMTQDFRQKFMNVNSTDYRENNQNNQIYQLQNIFANLKFSNRRSFTTRAFCQSFITYEGRPIDPTIQSDADQFFSTLMQKIESFLKQKNQMQILKSTFQGTLSNQLNCEGCPHRSQKQDHFLQIGVNIKNKKTLDQALRGYVDGQILDGDNAYLCQPCNKKVRTMKRLCIKQLPNVLVIVLKRFQFNYDQMRRIKINHELKYPQELNMKEYTSAFLDGLETGPDQDYLYNLNGVVVHSGTSQGGHYYSFIKNQDKWYEFNDQFISEENFKKVQEQSYGGQQKDFDGENKIQKYKSAYILFYHKNIKKQFIQEKKLKMQEDNKSFAKQLQQSVLANNANVQFMSLIMDPGFVRFCQNLAMIENIQAVKFVLLFYHTSVLRDRNRDQYAANLYRILQNRLQSEQISKWFLQQINYSFIRQFYIEAPKLVRNLSIGFLIKAISVAKQLPDNFLKTLVFALNKKGMSPYAKIFKILSKNQVYRQKLKQLEYDKRVLSYLLQKKGEVTIQLIGCQKIDSYFGHDASKKQKPVQFCPYALIQSLTYFDINQADAFALFQTYNGKQCNRICCKIIIKSNINDPQMIGIHINNLLNKVKENDYKKEPLDKYMSFLKQMCTFNDKDQNFQKRIQIGVKTLADLMMSMISTYDPIESTLKQIYNLAVKSPKFVEVWRKYLDEDASTKRAIMGWVKQSDRPHFLGKCQQHKRKISNMNYSQKRQYQSQNKAFLQQKTKWMFNKIQILQEYKAQNQDLDEAEINTYVTINNKKVLVKQHLGLLSKVDYEKQTRWCLIQRNDIEMYHSL